METVNDFEKEVIQRLTAIEEQNKTQFKQLEKLDHAINGNGQPGLKQNVESLGSRMQTVEDKARSCKESKDYTLSITALVIAALSAIVSWFKNGN